MFTQLTTFEKYMNRLVFVIVTVVFIFGKAFENVQCLKFIEKNESDSNLQVETRNGIVQGFQRKTENGKDVFMYQGIPFATPPLYDLRFRSPQPQKNWSGVLDARYEASSCVEIIIRLDGLNVTGNEDCLYLNVYSPINPHDSDERVPVLFWIYGGAFVEGNNEINNPDLFIDENILVVTSNYRTGIFGFLSTEDEAIPGNFGLKDQNAALRWVQKNIENFGGDPNRVTIIGQSAGACSVMYHMASPKSIGLFHGAVVMSGSILSPWCHQKDPRKVANDISLYMGLSMENSTTFVENLRKMDSEVLIRGQILPFIVNFLQFYQNGLVFTPVKEVMHKDAFITESTYKLIESGKFAKVPLIIGVTSLELQTFRNALKIIKPLLLIFDLSPSLIPTGININPPEQRRIVGNKIIKRYFKSQSISAATLDELLYYISDVQFVYPTWKILQLISKYIPIYTYVFDYKGEGASKQFGSTYFQQELKGIGHGADLPYMWKTPNLNERDATFSVRFTRIWANFIKYSNPTPVIDELLYNVTWPPVVSLESASYLYINKEFSVHQNYRKDYMSFWNEVFKKYSKKPFYMF